MYPEREEAKRLLEEANERNPGPWRDHSLVAARCAEKIAAACGMDPEKAYVLGLLHDIGRRFGVTALSHVIDGYDFLLGLGYPEAARVCLTHSFSLQNLEDYVGKRDVPPETQERIRTLLSGIEYDDYDRLIQLCDGVSMPQGPVPMEERLSDVRRRYGSYPQEKWEKCFQLKAYFEEKAGRGLYEILSVLSGS